MSKVVSGTSKYPLKLEDWSDDALMVISRGHHDLNEFSRFVSEHYDHYGDFFGSAYWTYYKAVPSRDGSIGYSSCSPTTKGAFPATVAQEGWMAEFGDKTWDRTVFPHLSKVVLINPKRDEPLTLETVHGLVNKGETNFSITYVKDGQTHYRLGYVSDYRLATPEDLALWEEQQVNLKAS